MNEGTEKVTDRRFVSRTSDFPEIVVRGISDFEKGFWLGKSLIQLFAMPKGNDFIHFPVNDQGGAMDILQSFHVSKTIPRKNGYLGYGTKGGKEWSFQNKASNLGA